jgi:aryl-alcohol dehydrogenase-like predicted oxidoreductase
LEYRQLSRTEIDISVIGLGTMTFGEQNTEAEGYAQLDYALDHGVNFLDTAEMYSVPPRAETQGSTERILGTWLRKIGNCSKVVLATKVAGPTRVLAVDYLRGRDDDGSTENEYWQH